ncbi:MAG: HAMP domain-containing histidine kinase [Alphaproteobacteria bacterium]|nr:HAMP domain-containing histidine kinase [Alphaproteobacteria bacterium]
MSALSPHLAEQLARDQMTDVARTTLREIALMPVTGLGLAIFGSIFIDKPQSLAWLMAMLGAALVQHVACTRLLKLEQGAAWRSAARFMIGASLLHNMIVSAFTVILWRSGANEINLVLLMISMASVTFSVSLTSSSLVLFPVNIAIYTGTSIAMCLIEGGAFFNAVGVLGTLYCVVVANSGYSGYLRMRSMLMLGYERDGLIAKLRDASRAKSAFLANMSHELRTPLNAILGFSEIIKDEIMGPAAGPLYRGYAGDIHSSGQHLLGLVNDILDLAKIEAGRFEIADSTFAVEDLVDEVFKLMRVQARKSRVLLAKDIGRSISIRWDRRAAKQILLNLMSNALKFTPAGGHVAVSAGMAADGGAWVRVKDSGCGIDPKDHGRVFETFGQARHDIAVSDKSTGLGLPIARGLVEAHGGAITLESAVGRGAAFTIHMPADRVAPREPASTGSARAVAA